MWLISYFIFRKVCSVKVSDWRWEWRCAYATWSGWVYIAIWVCLFDGVLNHFQQYFSYIVAVNFIGGGNRRTRRKPPTCRESLTNYHKILYTSPWSRFKLTTSVVIGTNCIHVGKSNKHMITTTTAPVWQFGIYRIFEYLSTSIYQFAVINCKSIQFDICHQSRRLYLYAREYRRGNRKWTIKRNWQQDEDKQNKNTTQYVLDITIRKQTQIT